MEEINKKRQEVIKLKEKYNGKCIEIQEVTQKIKDKQKSIDFFEEKIRETKDKHLRGDYAKCYCEQTRNNLIILGGGVLLSVATAYGLIDYTLIADMTVMAAGAYTLVAIPAYLNKTKDERKDIMQTVNNSIDLVRFKNAFSRNKLEKFKLQMEQVELQKDINELCKMLYYENISISMLENKQAETITNDLEDTKPLTRIREK